MANHALPDPYTLGGCVYYSQNREDLILQSFFPGEQKGFYVDIGAFDPDVDSVTKLFYEKGWHGINVEPQVVRYEQFQKIRPRDINLNIGISTENTTLNLRTYKSEGLSTFSDTIKQEYEQAPDSDTTDYTETTIKVRPLREVFAEQKVKHIDFMKVDVEGLEYEVLASNDWDAFRPEVLCIEANHVKNDWHPLLKSVGYEFVFEDGLNEYFADSQTDRKQKFNFVKDIITDRGGGLRADHYTMMLQIHSFALQKDHHVQELAKENEELKKRITQYESERNSIKYTTKQLTRLARQKVKKAS